MACSSALLSSCMALIITLTSHSRCQVQAQPVNRSHLLALLSSCVPLATTPVAYHAGVRRIYSP